MLCFTEKCLRIHYLLTPFCVVCFCTYGKNNFKKKKPPDPDFDE